MTAIARQFDRTDICCHSATTVVARPVRQKEPRHAESGFPKQTGFRIQLLLDPIHVLVNERKRLTFRINVPIGLNYLRSHGIIWGER